MNSSPQKGLAPSGAYGIVGFAKLTARLPFMQDNANSPTVLWNSNLPRCLRAIRFTVALARTVSVQLDPLALAIVCIV